MTSDKNVYKVAILYQHDQIKEVMEKVAKDKRVEILEVENRHLKEYEIELDGDLHFYASALCLVYRIRATDDEIYWLNNSVLHTCKSNGVITTYSTKYLYSENKEEK